MREFIDVTGKTEDEALSKALEQLGLERDDVSVEILSAPSPASWPWQLSRQSAGVLRRGDGACCAARPRCTGSACPCGGEAGRPAPRRGDPGGRPRVRLPLPGTGGRSPRRKSQSHPHLLTGLLAQMESEAEVRVYLPEKGRYKVILEGKNRGP